MTVSPNSLWREGKNSETNTDISLKSSKEEEKWTDVNQPFVCIFWYELEGKPLRVVFDGAVCE